MRNDSGVEKKKTAAEKGSFQWSNIFGIDRKKKSSGLIYHPLENLDKKRKKRCDATGCDEADYSEFNQRIYVIDWVIDPCNWADEEDYEDEDYRRKKKRSKEEKLEAMDRKLKAIENLIIDDTAKYYDNRDGKLIAWAITRESSIKF